MRCAALVDELCLNDLGVLGAQAEGHERADVPEERGAHVLLERGEDLGCENEPDLVLPRLGHELEERAASRRSPPRRPPGRRGRACRSCHVGAGERRVLEGAEQEPAEDQSTRLRRCAPWGARR